MTFISNSKKFVFVHLHKCGGTSVERALSKDIRWNDVILGSTPYGEMIQNSYRKQFGIYKHSSASDIKKMIGDELWEQYFTFSIVRHPIDRLVSYYAYLKTHYLGKYRGSAIRLMYFLDQIRPVPEPLTQIPRLYDAFRWPGIVACLKSNSIADFIHSDSVWKSYGTMSQFAQLSNEIDNCLLVDYVGRLEDISTNWQFVSSKIGIDTPLPHSNKSKRKYKEWRKYFSLDDINFLADKYKEDMEHFGYSV
ncbi:MAG: sulfotransferase family 2 domain-containing protein [Cyanobacteria bacterium P01_D01_bin.156]